MITAIKKNYYLYFLRESFNDRKLNYIGKRMTRVTKSHHHFYLFISKYYYLLKQFIKIYSDSDI